MTNFYVREEDRRAIIAYHCILDKWSRKKAIALLLLANGLAPKDVALDLGVSRESIYTWKKQYLKYGLRSLIGRNCPRE